MLAWMKRRIDNNYDNVVVLTGDEGAGKSKLARRLAADLDPTFDLDRIHFRFTDFFECAVKLKPGQAIVADEVTSMAFSRDAMGGDNKEFMRFLTECRKRRLHIFVCWPNINYLDKLVRGHRMKVWIYVEDRGKNRVAVVKRPLPTHMIGARPHAPTVFEFPFTGDNDPVDESEYEAKALAASSTSGSKRGSLSRLDLHLLALQERRE